MTEYEYHQKRYVEDKSSSLAAGILLLIMSFFFMLFWKLSCKIWKWLDGRLENRIRTRWLRAVTVTSICIIGFFVSIISASLGTLLYDGYAKEEKPKIVAKATSGKKTSKKKVAKKAKADTEQNNTDSLSVQNTDKTTPVQATTNAVTEPTQTVSAVQENH